MKTPIQLCRGICAQPESNLSVRFYEICGFLQIETHQESPPRRFAVFGGGAARIVLIGALCALFGLAGPKPVRADQLSGAVVAWGSNRDGQVTVPAVASSNVVAIAAGASFSLALKADGSAVGWGVNWGGQATVPAGLSEVVAVSAGFSHSLALESDGTVVAWGAMWDGQNYAPATVPAGLSGIVAISAGEAYSLALKSDGTVVGWGFNIDGRASPPPGLTGVEAIDAGGGHSLALKADGSVVGWGYDGDRRATAPAGLSGVVAISAGEQHSLALKSDGTVIGWGNNAFGQTTVPTGLSGVVAISAGSRHSLALKSDGTVVGWGNNTNGQLSAPVELSRVKAIAAGDAHSLALSRSEQAPSVYVLGEISDQTVWSGSSRTFLVGGDSLTMTAVPAPKGQIEFAPDTALQWAFRYTPDTADIKPFQVTISGGGKTQTFWVTPQPSLPPERSVFPTDRHTQPAISTYEPTVVDTPTALPEPLNYQNSVLRNVRIVGETVEFEAGHQNGLYDAYGTGRRDLKSMEIVAETVVIRSPIWLKQTAVMIRARDLIFEGGGKLQTTPEEILLKPDAFSVNGVDGLKAGNVILHIGSFANRTTNQIVLDLSGGRGQPGGRGQHGINGVNAPEILEDYQRVTDVAPYPLPPFFTIIFGAYQAVHPDKITYVYHSAWEPDGEWGNTNRQTSGTAAKPSGKPGEGGSGGSLTSSIALADAFTTTGGLSAEPTVPATAPFDLYKGGVGGNPSSSLHVYFYSTSSTIIVEKLDRHVTTNGFNAEVRKALTVAGANGSMIAEPALFSWVDPLWLRKALNHVQSDYLGGNIDAAQARLQDFATILSEMRESPEWLALDEGTRLELGQMGDEIEILRQRIQSGLDYFGNPAGWTPMLSFEVTKSIFEGEIDRAIETLYLTYWIGNKAQTEQQLLNSLQAARDQLREDLEQARTEYDDAVENLPVLDARAVELQAQIRTSQNELEVEERRLLAETGDPAWVANLRIGLKVAATICQMVPVAQPALYVVGQAVRVASDIDPDHPWSSITNAPTIADAYKNSPFKSAATNQQATKNGIDPKQAETNSFDYVTALQQSSVGLQAGVTDIRKFLAEQNAPTAEMLAELEELKSQSPRYKELLEQVEALMEENRIFSEDVVFTMQRIATLSDLMTHNLLAIDALNKQIAPAVTVLDERAVAYLDNMERRAQDRLLKYHYYMAKAYEYRMLKPYTQPLNLEGLFKKFEEIATLNSGENTPHEITPDQFTTFRQIYHDLVADVAESIYDEYTSNPPEKEVLIRFNLSEDEIASLNADEALTINPYHRGLFPVEHENVRIVDLRVFSMTTEVEGGGGYGSPAYVDLTMAHSGVSHLKQDGKVLIFRHYNNQTENPIIWSGRFDPVDNRIDPIRPSEAADSLLRSLLSGPATADMLLYSRPSGWADLTVTRDDHNSNGRKILLKSARLELVYDFSGRNDGLGLRTLEVTTAGVEPGAPGGEPRLVEFGMQPLFTLDKADVNDRQHGRGQFLRVYRSGAGMVQLTAPETYGEWRFHQWADAFGAPLPGGANPTILLNMSRDSAVTAQYILPGVVAPTLQLPVLSGSTLLLRWAGGRGILLQSAGTINGPWTDVPGSEGVSQLSVSTAPGQGFFRAVQR